MKTNNMKHVFFLLFSLKTIWYIIEISNSWPYCDLLPAYFAIYFWPSLAFHEIQILILEFLFFCHKHFHIYSVLLRNMRLSNFTFLSVLSFADKPKLAYLTRPTKKGGKTRKLSAKINTNSSMIFESKMNLKSISVCSKSINITAILINFFRWLQYSWV